jgi:hypothetical protein
MLAYQSLGFLKQLKQVFPPVFKLKLFISVHACIKNKKIRKELIRLLPLHYLTIL